MRTTYPAQIDNSSSLPRVIDNLTPVIGAVYNRLLEAVIAIETELGVKPSALNTTVRSRLDNLEIILSKLQLNLQFGGDVEAQEDPTIQHIIGIRGNPILDNPSLDVGNSMRWDGTNWTQVKLYQDDILPPFFITLNGQGIQEVNKTLSYPEFIATYNFDPPDYIEFSDSDGNSQEIDLEDRLNFYSNYEFQKTSFGETVIFTLSAVHHGTTRTVTFNIIWGQKLYWGVGPTGYITESDIKDNLTGTITSSVDSEFTVTAGLTDKIYFACRNAFGTPTFSIGGIDGGFTLVSDTISLTNDYGFTENYALYESDNSGLGETTVIVS